MRLLGTILLFTCFITLEAQTDFRPPERPVPSRQKSFSLNVSGLLAGFIPFGGNNPTEVGPVSFRVKSFREKLAWRTGLGFNIPEFMETDDGEQNYFTLAFGLEWQSELAPKFSMTYGGDLLFAAGGFNLPGGDEDEFGGFALAPFIGLAYPLDDWVSLTVESALLAGPNSANGGLLIKTIPPISVFLQIYWDKPLNRKRRDRRR